MKERTRSVEITSFYCDGEMKDKIEKIIQDRHRIRSVKFSELMVGEKYDVSNLTYRIRATKKEVKMLAKCLEYYGLNIVVNRNKKCMTILYQN